MRSPRFRLTVAYALFSTVLLAGGGLVVRSVLARNLDQRSRDTTEQEWLAVKGFLRIRDGMAAWFYDREDPRQTEMVARLQRIYLLTDNTGKLIHVSDIYRSLGPDTPQEIRAVIRSGNPAWKVRNAARDGAYLLRSGVFYSNDKRHDPYFVAIGSSLTDNQRVLRQFNEIYLGLMATMLAGGLLFYRFIPDGQSAPI